MASVAQDTEDGVFIRGKCVALKKRTITPKPHPETGEVRPAFDKYELVVESAGQTYEVSYSDEREARVAAGARDRVTGAIEVAVASVRGGSGGRVYWNGGQTGGGAEFLDLD